MFTTPQGGIAYNVTVQVPTHHGLEPDVTLRYSSGSSAVWAGRGWSLACASEITQHSPLSGVLDDSGTDVFLLDGARMRPCQPSNPVSASCLHGGNFELLDDDGSKIRREGATIWDVWQPNGKHFRYESSLKGRWLLRSVSDAHGNSVEYRYSSSQLTDYLSSIEYGNAKDKSHDTKIVFHYVDRRDVLSGATGAGLAVDALVPASIEVRVDGRRQRVLALEYDSGALLLSATEYGSDAVLSAMGVVSSGSSLPAQRFEYEAILGDVNKLFHTKSPIFEQTSVDELIHSPADTPTLIVDTSLPYEYLDANTNDDNTGAQLWSAVDLDGDGVDELISPSVIGTTKDIEILTIRRDGTTARTTTPWRVVGLAPYSYFVLPANLNGDRFVDLLCLSDSSGVIGIELRVATGSPAGFVFGQTPVVTFAGRGLQRSRWGPVRPFVGDRTGDGLPDLTLLVAKDPQGINGPINHDLEFLTAASNGDGTFGAPQSSLPFPNGCAGALGICATPSQTAYWRGADLNGDGLIDFTAAFPGNQGCGNSCPLLPCTMPSLIHRVQSGLDGSLTGRSQSGPSWCSPQQQNGSPGPLRMFGLDDVYTVFNNNSPTNAVVGDFDGDGRSDWLLINAKAGSTTFGIPYQLARSNERDFIANGDGELPLPSQFINKVDLAWTTWSAADLDADGRDDLLVSTPIDSTGAITGTTNVSWIRSLGGGQFESVARELPNEPARPYHCYYDSTGGCSRPKHTIIAAQLRPGKNLEIAYIAPRPNNSSARFVVQHLPSTVATSPRDLIVADASGDGRNDILRVRNSQNGFSVDQLNGPAFGLVPSHTELAITDPGAFALPLDFNGPSGLPDGKSDLIFVSNGYGTTPMKTYAAISNGDGTYLLHPPQSHSGVPRLNRVNWLTGDFNGDGVTDLANLQPGVATQTIWFFPQRTTQLQFSRSVGVAGAVLDWGVGNFNGDAQSDIYIVTKGTEVKINWLRLTGGQWILARSTPLPAALAGRTFANHWQATDSNGDGVTDFGQVLVSRANYTVNLDLLIGTGNGEFVLESASAPGASMATSHRWRPIDVNRDGRAEWVAILPRSVLWESRTAVLHKSGGSWTIQAAETWCSDGRCSTGDQEGLHFAADLDGDGLQELVSLGFSARAIPGIPDAQGFTLTSFNPHAVAPLLSRVVNGIGYDARIVYSTSGGAHVSYWSGSQSVVAAQLTEVIGAAVTPPTGNPPPPTSAPSPQYIDTSFTWSGLRANQLEAPSLGSIAQSLGFERVVSTTKELSLAGDVYEYSSETVYDQSVCPGRPVAVKNRLNANETESENSIWVDRSRRAAAPYAHCVVDSTSTSYQTGRTIKFSRMTSDEFGNVRKVEALGELASGSDVDPTDNHLVENEYAPVGPAYVANLPFRTTTRANGMVVEQTKNLYDNMPLATQISIGDLTQVRRYNSITGSDLEWSSSFDRYGNKTSDSTPEGRKTTWTFEPRHNKFAENECNDLFCKQTEWDYLAQQPHAILDENLVSNERAYDVFQRQTRNSWSNGECIDYRYLDFGLDTQRTVTDVCDRSGNDGPDNALWVENYFDGLGRTMRERRALGATRYMAYFGGSKARSGEADWSWAGQFAGWTRILRDARGEEYQRTLPDSSVISTNWSNGSRVVTDQLQRVVEHETDGWGRASLMREHTNGMGLETQYKYDWASRLTEVVDPAANKTTYAYSTLGRKYEECDPARRCTRFEHWPDGQLLRQTNAKGESMTFEYDALGRRRYRSDSNGDSAEWTYDRAVLAGATNTAGRLSATATSDGVLEYFSYDARGRQTAVQRCVGSTCGGLETTYDESGLAQFVTYPDPSGQPGGEVVERTFDLDGRVTSIIGYAPTVGFDAANRLERMDFQGGASQLWSYDSRRGWVDEVRVSDSNNNVLLGISDSHDLAGQLRTRTVTDPSSNRRDSTFQHDDLGRLENEVDSATGGRREEYSYDSIGNMTSSHVMGRYEYLDPAVPYSVSTTAAGSYAHDLAGRLETDPQATFKWNVDGTLESVFNQNGKTFYLYTADGARVSKKSSYDDVQYFAPEVEHRNGQYINLIYLGLHPVAERNGSNVMYFHADGARNVRLATRSGSAVLGVTDYSAYGINYSTLQTSLSYAGHHYDSETGLIYMNARYMDPALGRFVSPDNVTPVVGRSQSANGYAYALNSPYSFYDQDGHSPLRLGIQQLATGYGLYQYMGPVTADKGGPITIGPGAEGLWESMMRVPDTAARAHRIAEIARSPAFFGIGPEKYKIGYGLTDDFGKGAGLTFRSRVFPHNLVTSRYGGVVGFMWTKFKYRHSLLEIGAHELGHMEANMIMSCGGLSMPEGGLTTAQMDWGNNLAMAAGGAARESRWPGSADEHAEAGNHARAVPAPTLQKMLDDLYSKAYSCPAEPTR